MDGVRILLQIAVALGVVTWLFLTQQRVYHSGEWGKATAAFIVTGMLYLPLLIGALLVTIALAFVL